MNHTPSLSINISQWHCHGKGGADFYEVNRGSSKIRTVCARTPTLASNGKHNIYTGAVNSNNTTEKTGLTFMSFVLRSAQRGLAQRYVGVARVESMRSDGLTRLGLPSQCEGKHLGTKLYK